MSFHGVFIGVDRYVSAQIQDLTCAARDAIALAALFEDTLGGSVKLLTDTAATGVAIKSALSDLALCDADDVVVIGFSGHGSEDHRLVPCDTDLRDLENSAISLLDLQGLFAAIPARRLLLILDCCFSGGIGAKVLAVDARPREIASVEARLAQLAGEGRVILTASGSTEPAWEHGRHGHGLLTYFLIEALTGAEETQRGERVSLLKVLAHVTERVQAAALIIGQPQTPCVRGTFDGDLAWPTFVRGDRWHHTFPGAAPTKVDGSLASLVSAGLLSLLYGKRFDSHGAIENTYATP